MKFYHIKDDFINYLRQFDPKVSSNKNEARPYVGVVLEIGQIKYYAPFTSPKEKHKKMKNGKDFRKISNGLYGAINFNNMIPVQDDAVMEIDFSKIADLNYRYLLYNQYQAIEADKTEILRTASNLRALLLKSEVELSPNDRKIKERCCDLRLLEEKYKGWSA